MKYLANTDNKVTRGVAVNAVEEFFPGRSADIHQKAKKHSKAIEIQAVLNHHLMQQSLYVE